MELGVGQTWRISDEPELADARLVIGAVVDFGSGLRLICCSAMPAIKPNGRDLGEVVPFLPLSEDAFRRSVLRLESPIDPADDFAAHMETWRDDPRGLRYFTVPFEGSIDRLVAMQMAALIKPAGDEADA